MELCRLCHLETHPNTCRNLFFTFENGLKLFEIITKLTEINIHENDPFPKIVCNDCCTTLFQFNNFRKIVVQADLKFHEEFKQITTRIKQEDVDENLMEINETKEASMQIKSEIQINDDDDESFAVLQNDERPYQCRTCHKQFTHKFSLMGHLRVHTHEKPFRCYICYKRYPLKQTLQEHLLIHKNARIFSCDSCPKRFYRKSYLNQHLKLHNINNPYRCTYCNRVCLSAIYLKKHLRCHTKEKPYTCTICNKAFSEKCNLTKHQLIHDSIKSFQCEICKKFLTSKHTMKAHLVRHTNCTNTTMKKSSMVKPFVCDICNRDFVLKGSLRRHLKQKH